MELFVREIRSIAEVDRLVSRKERIKNSVMQPDLKWDKRAELYKQVQIINERILSLKEERA